MKPCATVSPVHVHNPHGENKVKNWFKKSMVAGVLAVAASAGTFATPAAAQPPIHVGYFTKSVCQEKGAWYERTYSQVDGYSCTYTIIDGRARWHLQLY